MNARIIGTVVVLFVIAGTACQTRPVISFSRDVYPLLEQNCLECHSPPDGKGYRLTGLNMQDYDSLMAGTFYGPVIVPGNAGRSILNMLVEGRADDSMRMPHNRATPLADAEIRTLQLWVRQGAHNN